MIAVESPSRDFPESEMEPLRVTDVGYACLMKAKRFGWDSLADVERVMVLGEHFYFQTTTCGLDAFYRHAIAEHTEETVWALEQIEAYKAVYLLGLCNSLCPGGRPATDFDERNRQVTEFVDSSALPPEACDADAPEWEDVYDLLAEYLRAHEKHFRKHGLTGEGTD